MRDGGSSAQAMPLSNRATLALSVCLFSSKIANSASSVKSSSTYRLGSRIAMALLNLESLIPYPGHPVADVVGKKFQPFMEPPLVQQPSFAIEELLHLTDGRFTHGSLLPVRSRAIYDFSPTVTRHELRPAPAKLAMVALAHAKLAGPYLEGSHRTARAPAPSACSTETSATPRRDKCVCTPANCPCRPARRCTS